MNRARAVCPNCESILMDPVHSNPPSHQCPGCEKVYVRRIEMNPGLSLKPVAVERSTGGKVFTIGSIFEDDIKRLIEKVKP